MKVWVRCARGVQVAYVTLHHRGCTLVPPSTWAKRLPRVVQELISRDAEMEAHIDDVSLGTNTQEDYVLLLREFFIVCQENHL